MVALAMGVHAIVNQKFVGHLIIIVYWIGMQVLSKLGLDHRLYQVGRAAELHLLRHERLGSVSSAHPHARRLLASRAAWRVATLGYLVLVRGTDTGWRARRARRRGAMARMAARSRRGEPRRRRARARRNLLLQRELCSTRTARCARPSGA